MYDVARLADELMRLNKANRLFKLAPRSSGANSSASWHLRGLWAILWIFSWFQSWKLSWSTVTSPTNQTRKRPRVENSVEVHLCWAWGSSEDAARDIVVENDKAVVGAMVEMDTLMQEIYRQQQAKHSVPTDTFKQIQLDGWFETLYVPAVVPEFRGLSVAGLVAGAGLESSSFRFGGFAEGSQVIHMEGITPQGKPWSCDSGDSDARRAVLGTLGSCLYTTRITLQLVPAWPLVKSSGQSSCKTSSYKTPMVELKIRRVTVFELIPAIQQTLLEPVDYIEAVVLNRLISVIVTGKRVGLSRNQLAAASLVSFSQPADHYYISYLQRCASTSAITTAYTPMSSYLFRWDRLAFWCGFEAYSDLQSLSLPISSNSRTARSVLDPIMSSRELYKLLHATDDQDWILQDFYVPINRLGEFLDKLMHGKDALGVFPMWLCPIKTSNAPFMPSCLDGDMAVNVGVYGIPQRLCHGLSDEALQSVNTEAWIRRLEEMCMELGGRKMLHARSVLSIWHMYDEHAYKQLKLKFDPDGRLTDLHAKLFSANILAKSND